MLPVWRALWVLGLIALVACATRGQRFDWVREFAVEGDLGCVAPCEELTPLWVGSGPLPEQRRSDARRFVLESWDDAEQLRSQGSWSERAKLDRFDRRAEPVPRQDRSQPGRSKFIRRRRDHAGRRVK